MVIMTSRQGGISQAKEEVVVAVFERMIGTLVGKASVKVGQLLGISGEVGRFFLPLFFNSIPSTFLQSSLIDNMLTTWCF